MKEDKTPSKTSSGKENEPVVENGKKKVKEEKPATKVVVRRLPPTMTEEQFKLQVSPLPDFDYFYYMPADMSLTPNAFSRAYINFVDQSDLFIFTQKFDGYVFLDSKGGEFTAVVEFAPFQRIPKNRPNRRKDPRTGTIENDPVFTAFKERMEAESLENKATANASKQHFFETSLAPEKKEVNNTPLLEFIKNRKADRQRIREEKREEKRKKDSERRRVKEEQRRIKKEDDISVVKPFPSSTSHSIPKIPDDTTSSQIAKASLKNDNMEKNECSGHENKKKYCFQSDDVTNEHDITKKVRDLVGFFNKKINDNCDSDLEKTRDMAFINCVNHKDVETKIIKNIVENKLQHKNAIQNKTAETQQNNVLKNWHKLNFSVPPSHFNESNHIKTSYKPLLEARARIFVPQSRSCNRKFASSIIMKPVPTNSSLHNNLPKEHGAEVEDLKDTCKTNFHSEVFRKNLQKVVADVLGSSKVRTPKENVISKPKTFIKRVFVGSGEQCARPGFNSPSFYLPPRTYGCGPTESLSTSFREENLQSENMIYNQSPRPLKTISPGKGHLPTFSRKTLPPFSKKNIFSSKSDGDIEKTECDVKVGGSQESLTRKMETWGFDVKPQLVRRPNVAPRKSVILIKNNKVTL